jgi:hypothetical protein
MSTRSHISWLAWQFLLVMMFIWPALGSAQVPVDGDGNPIGDHQFDASNAPTGNEDIPRLSAGELEELVGPIALYPDDLLAIVLPASTFPLQIVQANRFLEDLQADPSLQPDETWDDAVVALVNYPEVVELLNDDLDWTWRLGEAVVSQQPDVIAAVESFRDRAYAAGNLKSDSHQIVSYDEGVIEIEPVSDDIIYVPYYEPERVVVYQPRPAYYYYPQPYPVYYYPYPAGHAFHHGFFWGVTTAFSVGWYTDSLHVFHHSYHGHPYYGYSYWDRWWYRRPTIHVHNTIYVNNRARRSHDHYRSGDYWQPRTRRTLRYTDQRVTRTRQYPSDYTASIRNSGSVSVTGQSARPRHNNSDSRDAALNQARTDIRFRERPAAEPRSIRGDQAAAVRQARARTREAPRDRSSASKSRNAEPALRPSQPSRARLGDQDHSQPKAARVRRAEPQRAEPHANTSRREGISQMRRNEPSRERTQKAYTSKSEPKSDRQPKAEGTKVARSSKNRDSGQRRRR